MIPGIGAEDRLAALLNQLMHGRRVEMLERAWIVDGLLQYVRNPDQSLEACLGLAGPGRRHINKTIALIQRNQHLALAIEAISLDDRVSTWARCERLACHVAELTRAWSRTHRCTPTPPDAWPEWKCHLFRAWRTGRQIPATPEGLLKALNKCGISVQSAQARLSPYVEARLNHEVVRNPGPG